MPEKDQTFRQFAWKIEIFRKFALKNRKFSLEKSKFFVSLPGEIEIFLPLIHDPTPEFKQDKIVEVSSGGG